MTLTLAFAPPGRAAGLLAARRGRVLLGLLAGGSLEFETRGLLGLTALGFLALGAAALVLGDAARLLDLEQAAVFGLTLLREDQGAATRIHLLGRQIREDRTARLAGTGRGSRRGGPRGRRDRPAGPDDRPARAGRGAAGSARRGGRPASRHSRGVQAGPTLRAGRTAGGGTGGRGGAGALRGALRGARGAAAAAAGAVVVVAAGAAVLAVSLKEGFVTRFGRGVETLGVAAGASATARQGRRRPARAPVRARRDSSAAGAAEAPPGALATARGGRGRDGAIGATGACGFLAACSSAASARASGPVVAGAAAAVGGAGAAGPLRARPPRRILGRFAGDRELALLGLDDDALRPPVREVLPHRRLRNAAARLQGQGLLRVTLSVLSSPISYRSLPLPLPARVCPPRHYPCLEHFSTVLSR